MAVSNEIRIDELIKHVELHRRAIEKSKPKILDAIEETAMSEASAFESATYDDGQSTNDSHVESARDENSVTITATGTAVPFIEYGAGVHYNGSEPYPEPRPAEIVHIGEYGKGHGKREGWYFNEDGETKFTRGTPAQMPMYKARKSVEKMIDKKWRELIKDD